MKNLLLENLIKDLSQISSMHDNCLDDVIKLYGSKEYQYNELEQTITKSISIDKKQQIEQQEEYNNEFIDMYFREEYDNEREITGTVNSLLIETATDIEI